MALLVDPGTDCEDELPTPASAPVVVDQQMDSELQRRVFVDVVSLPAMITPVGDMDGTLRMPQAECPVVAPPAMPALMNGPSQTLSSVGPKCVSPMESARVPASVDVSPALRSPPVVTVSCTFMWRVASCLPLR